MDAADFSVQFDPIIPGLIGTVEGSFLQGQTERMSIRPELYKLNVYGSV